MHEKYTSIGLMSGTSGDGVDASMVYSDGFEELELIYDKYFEYDRDIFKSFHLLKDKINGEDDLKKTNVELRNLERKITLFHAKILKEFDLKNKNILIGFHGQTIYHNPNKKISMQLGDGHLLNQLIEKKVIYNFRKNDILNGGEGAPLTPIFHKLLALKYKLKLPSCIINIGGISNCTVIKKMEKIDHANYLFSKDIGPGNCLIDSWVRKNSKEKYDEDGKLAQFGEINKIILEQAQELYINSDKLKKRSFDVNDFDVSFARGLSLEDGAATLTEFTSQILLEKLNDLLSDLKVNIEEFVLCGGGRKNKLLVKKIKENLPLNSKLKMIDDYNIKGDFVESQAFAYLAIRSFLKLPLTFPSTTGCRNDCLGGEIIDN